jgi:pantetheine-phosphate adenylyltransferase
MLLKKGEVISLKIYNDFINKDIDIEDIFKKNLIKISFNKIKDIYNSPGREYHNFEHIVKMIKNIKFYSEELIVAIIFHDIVYNYNSNKNEADSAEFFKEHCFNKNNEFLISVEKAIIATAFPEQKNWNIIEKEIVRVDRIILYSNDMKELFQWEDEIFRENQIYRVAFYREMRVKFLEKAFNETKNQNLLILKEIVKNKRYKIGFYPGSFNPFHIGHYNILKKAEKIFDKVIIGIGKNFDKIKNDTYDIPKKLRNREIIEYGGLITTVIEELKQEGDIFIVRGLRNEYDLQYEENLRNSIKDFLPEQNFAYFFCDKEFEHISSSLIRDIRSRDDKNVSEFIKKYCLE